MKNNISLTQPWFIQVDEYSLEARSLIKKWLIEQGYYIDFELDDKKYLTNVNVDGLTYVKVFFIINEQVPHYSCLKIKFDFRKILEIDNIHVEYRPSSREDKINHLRRITDNAQQQLYELIITS